MQSHQKRLGLKRAVIETLESRQLLSSPGTLDMSFGSGGKVSTDFSPLSADDMDVAVQSDGKIVVAGNLGHDFLITRYNANGLLDTSFGATHSGKVDIHVGKSGSDSGATSVAIETNGDIVVGGFADITHDDDPLGIVRLTPSGLADMTFGTDGQITYGGLPGFFEAGVAVQNDGKILLAGTTGTSFFDENEDLGVARFNANGSLDTSFGSSGLARAGFDTSASGVKVAVDQNGTASTNPHFGSIVVVGLINDPGKFAVARFTPSGKLDTSFNGIGRAAPGFTAFGETGADSVAIESDDSLLVSGSSFNAGVGVAHFLANGKVDLSFGSGNGLAIANSSETGISKVVIGYTGDVIVAVGGSSFEVAAFTPQGMPDTSFGTNGIAKISFANQPDAVIRSLTVTPDRHVIAVGTTGTDGGDINVAELFDVAPKVSVTSLDPTAGPTTHKRVGKLLEPVFNPASLIISRDLRLPFATRVFFTIGGSAKVPNAADIKFGNAGYTLSGMTIETSPATSKISYVDIPANQTFVTVTLSPENIPVSSTTATFTINSSALYDSGSPTNQTITILGTSAPPPPPTTTITDNADAYVEDGSDAAMNFGTLTKLEVKEGASGVNRQTYLKFDLSSVSTANSVKLTLFGELSSTDATNVLTQLFSVADTTWTENGITFNNKPAAGTSVLASATIANTIPTTYTFDVTAYVKAQLAMGIKTVSFVLKNPANSSPFILFNSKEAGSNAPALTIT